MKPNFLKFFFHKKKEVVFPSGLQPPPKDDKKITLLLKATYKTGLKQTPNSNKILDKSITCFTRKSATGFPADAQTQLL